MCLRDRAVPLFSHDESAELRVAAQWMAGPCSRNEPGHRRLAPANGRCWQSRSELGPRRHAQRSFRLESGCSRTAAAPPADPPPPPLAAAPLRPAFTEAELPAALAPAAPRPALDAPDIPATAAPAPPPAAAGPGAPATVLPLPPLAAGAPASAGAGDPAGPPEPAVGSITPAQFEQPADGWPADGPPWPATMGTAINRCGTLAGNPSEQAPSARATSAAYRGVPRGRNRPA